MSYLKFDKTLMINLEESLAREVLRTNQSGAYHCTTIVDCNTRKYHGLLVMPVPAIDDELHVLLSSLDATVVQHGAEFNLGLHKYRGDHFSPNGHKYIRQYDCQTVPTTVYRVGGVMLSKSTVFVHHENRILISYTLLDAHSETTLRFKPFLAFRSVRIFTHENERINRHYDEIENGIKTSLYPNYPELYMQFNKEAPFHYHPDWYRGLEYSKEKERGYYFDEDLYMPGYFEVSIKKGETIVFSAGVSPVDIQTLKQSFDFQVNDRTPRSSFFNCLRNSAHQFLNKQGDEHYILAGYPWFKARARDQFISLPGLTLAIDEIDAYHNVMETAIEKVKLFMKGEEVTGIYEIEKPDVLLWMTWAIQEYAGYCGWKKCDERYGDIYNQIITYIISNQHPNLVLEENGLLSTDGTKEAVSWMNSSVNGFPVVGRTGYLVEFNALWYNALRFKMELDAHKGVEDEDVEILTEKMGVSFLATFLNENGYLSDYVNGSYKESSVRPNMLFAIALEYSPLDRVRKKKVLDFVTKELVTPKGIRSLSPKSEGYNPYYAGTQTQRDYAYHQGTAWPWLMGFYLNAYLKIHKLSGLSFAERMLIGFEEEMTQHCIGTISELYDGNPPFKGKGAVSFAMNVAELLRVLKIIKTLNIE